MSSVSGLGIRTLFVTFNFKSLQKVIPQRYWIGHDLSKCSFQIDSKNSKFFFKCKFPSGFILIRLCSLVDIPPIQSSKTSKDYWSPPLESCFFFQNKNSPAEMLSIY